MLPAALAGTMTAAPRYGGGRPHGIRSGVGEPFHRFAEIGPAIEETLREAGVTLHLTPESRRLSAAPDVGGPGEVEIGRDEDQEG